MQTLITLPNNLKMLPIVPGCLAFTLALRDAFEQDQPSAFILELPTQLEGHLPDLLDELPTIKMLAWRDANGVARFLPTDPCDPRIEAIRLALEFGLPVFCIDTGTADAGLDPTAYPDPAALEKIGVGAWAEMTSLAFADEPVDDRTRTLALRLQRLAPRHEKTWFIGSVRRMAALRRLLSAPLHGEEVADAVSHVQALPLAENRLSMAVRELPGVIFRYELWRAGILDADKFSISEALEGILREAGDRYRDEFREEVNLTEWRALTQYARNLSLLAGGLRPGLRELVVAARGCVDGDFGLITLEKALSYMPNSDRTTPEEESPAESFLDDGTGGESDSSGGPRHQSLHLHADFPEGRERLSPAYEFPELTEITFNFRRRPRPTKWQRDKWREDFLSNPRGICSWPPEDEFLENFFRTVRHRAMQQISENHSSVEEFSSSVLDGLDVRETMRRWHEKKLFVKRERIPPGRVGPVVFIWEDLPLMPGPIWRTTLYAEHQNESDLSIYSTQPGEEMVGPGITRIEYHGVLSVFPARHIPDLWTPGSFLSAVAQLLPAEPTHARLLAAAGLLLSEEKYVAYVGPHPPDLGLRQLARQLGKGLVYLPLSTFSRTLLKRVRQSHILSGHHVRGWAADYITRL